MQRRWFTLWLVESKVKVGETEVAELKPQAVRKHVSDKVNQRLDVIAAALKGEATRRIDSAFAAFETKLRETFEDLNVQVRILQQGTGQARHGDMAVLARNLDATLKKATKTLNI